MRFAVALAVLSIAVGCEKPGGNQGACLRAAFETGDADGVGAPLSVTAGQSKAGRIAAADLPEDPSGLLLWRAGDFVLANERIAVVIEDVGDSDRYDPWGGKLVGLALTKGGAMVMPASFEEVIVGIGRFTVATNSVTVLHDGTDGEAAVVRASGPLAVIPFIDEVGQTLGVTSNYSGIEAALDYVLEPDSNVLEVHLTLRGVEDDVDVPHAFHFFFQGNQMPDYWPGFGFDREAAFRGGGPFPFVGFADDDAASYVWEPGSGALGLFFDQQGATVLENEPFTIEACADHSMLWARVTVGGPGLDEALLARAKGEGEERKAIAGTVLEADGTTPAEEVSVHAETADGIYITRALVDGDGKFALHVPVEDVKLTAFRSGTGAVTAMVDASDDSNLELTMPPFGTLHVKVAEDDVQIPAKVQVFTEGLVAAPKSFGVGHPSRGRSHIAYAAEGPAVLRVPAGDHRVVVSRGFEYDVFDETVNVEADATTDVEAMLTHVVDTSDALCGDFHVHTMRSPDSVDRPIDKTRAIAAEGLDIVARTDHEWVADLEDEVAALSLEDWLYTLSGVELTSFVWGHMGVYPLDGDATKPNRGAPLWAGMTPPEVFAAVRAREGTFGTPALVINHPRDQPLFTAYFDYVGFDDAADSVARESDWDPALHIAEVFNRSSFDENYTGDLTDPGPVDDWFALNSSSLLDGRLFAVASSDSHESASAPTGYPRTCLRTGSSTVSALREAGGAADVRDALDAGRAVIDGGIYVTAEHVSSGSKPGDRVMGASAEEPVHVVVQAPGWVDVTRLRAFVDGEMTEEIPIPAGVDTVRFEGDVMVTVEPGAGSWVVFVASGEAPLAPVLDSELPFGVTNPIFFQR